MIPLKSQPWRAGWLLLALAQCLSACDRGTVPSQPAASPTRDKAEISPRSPVSLEVPPLESATPYTKSELVVWVGSDGIAVTHDLVDWKAEDAAPVLRLEGGALLGEYRQDDDPFLTPLSDAIRAKIQTDSKPSIALVVDGKVPAKTLIAVTEVFRMLWIRDVRLAFPGDNPSMFAANTLAEPKTTARFEIRKGESTLALAYGNAKQLVSLGANTCTFSDPRALDATFVELCQGPLSNGVDIQTMLASDTTYADLIAVLNHNPRPKGCDGAWVLPYPLLGGTPSCGEAKSAEVAYDAVRPRPKEDGILGVWNDGEMAEVDLSALKGAGNKPPTRSGFGGPPAAVKTSVTDNGSQLDQEVVEMIVGAHHYGLGLCLEKRGPTTKAKFAVVVGTDGLVSSAKRVSKEVEGDADDKLIGCIAKSVEAWKFAPRPAEEHTFTLEVEIAAK